MDEATRYAKDVGGLPPDHPYSMLAVALAGSTTVLDVGCGSGELGAMLTDRGFVVDGIEVNAERAAVARTRLRSVVDGLAGGDRELDASYDAVLLVDVVEHVADGHALLHWCARHLESGGRIVALVPNAAHWSVRVKVARGDWSYDDTGIFDRDHVRFYDPDTIAALGATAGMRETERWTFDRPRRRKRLAGVKRRLAARWPGLFAYYVLVVWEPAP